MDIGSDPIAPTRHDRPGGVVNGDRRDGHRAPRPIARWVRRWLDGFRGALRLEEESPWRLALALAVGVFISFTPFYGLQTILSILVATVFRLNRAVTVAGAWLNLPWFAPFVYGAAVTLGALVLPDVSGLEGLSVALLIGTTILGAAAGIVTYIVALGLLRRRRARAARASPPPLPTG